MNQIVIFTRRHSLKVILPLLLLTTACGEDAASSSQTEAVPDLSDINFSERTATTTQNAPENVNAPTAHSIVRAAQAALGITATIPEPTGVVGLVAIALGLVATKRNRAKSS